MSKLFNPDYLQHLCQKYGLKPSKKYGQNFLIDSEVVEKILAAAEISKTDTVVEVGPGFGILTMPLVEHAGEVISFEIEKKLIPYWSRQENSFSNLKIIWGNVLKQFQSYNLPARLRYGEAVAGGQLATYKVVANVPYQITAPLIRLFLEAEHPPVEMILMVQKEVAERICAGPGDMSLLAISVQYYALAEIMFAVPRAAFWPSPNVASAVVRLRRKEQITMNNEQASIFFRLVKAGFAARRKLLIKNLRGYLGKEASLALPATFSRLNIAPQARAQELSLAQWIGLISEILK